MHKLTTTQFEKLKFNRINIRLLLLFIFYRKQFNARIKLISEKKNK